MLVSIENMVFNRCILCSNISLGRVFQLNKFLSPISKSPLSSCNSRSCTTVSKDEKEKELERIAKNASIDEPPTSCCQSGCANCVFIVWAEALSAKMADHPEIADRVINMVEDPSMKAYLEMELKIRGLKK